MVNMDQAHIKGSGLFLIPLNSVSGWPEVIKEREGKATMIKRVLRTLFLGIEEFQTIVTDSAQEFCNKNLR